MEDQLSHRLSLLHFTSMSIWNKKKSQSVETKTKCVRENDKYINNQKYVCGERWRQPRLKSLLSRCESVCCVSLYWTIVLVTWFTALADLTQSNLLTSLELFSPSNSLQICYWCNVFDIVINIGNGICIWIGALWPKSVKYVQWHWK